MKQIALAFVLIITLASLGMAQSGNDNQFVFHGMARMDVAGGPTFYAAFTVDRSNSWFDYMPWIQEWKLTLAPEHKGWMPTVPPGTQDLLDQRTNIVVTHTYADGTMAVTIRGYATFTLIPASESVREIVASYPGMGGVPVKYTVEVATQPDGCIIITIKDPTEITR